MGRAPCCDKANVKRGPWSPEEDATLKSYLQTHGTAGNWIALPTKAGLRRCGKSCRLRWLNYLRPDIKHGGFTEEEDHTICNLYNQMGSRWSVIASHLPGRTDNDVKNYWNTKLKKKLLAGKINLTTNNTTNFATQLIKTSKSNNNYVTPLPHNYSCVPKLLELPDDSSLQNPATLTMLTDHDQRLLSFQYDHKNSLFMNLLSSNDQHHIINHESVHLSQAGSDDVSTSLLAVNDIKPEEFDGTTLMDFGFGLSYDVMNDVSFDQGKANDNIISHDHHEVVGPSNCMSSTLFY